MDADTFAFQLTGPILTISTDMDTLKSGAVIEQVLVLTRQGSGTGVEGLWLDTREELRVISGTPSEKETAELEGGRKARVARRVYNRLWARFADGILTSYRDREFAKLFVAEWNGEFESEPDPGIPPNADSARYAITIKAVDKHTVELKGRTSGETVQITLDSEGMTYTSDKPENAPHRNLRVPKTCPNEHAPEWYDDFKQANVSVRVMEKVLEKGMGLEKARKSIRKAETPAIFPLAL